MDWNPPTLWAIAAGLAVALELLSGTFYLLMLAVGLASAALAGWAGAGFSAQMSVAALVSVLAVGLCHALRRRARSGSASGSGDSASVDALDVGETVQVEAWLPDGHAQVRYRGALWRAQPHPQHLAGSGGGPLPTGVWRVADLQGNTLRLIFATGR